MAATFAAKYSVFGDLRVAYGTATVAAQTSGAFKTGLNKIYGGVVAPCSCTSAVPNFLYRMNTNSANSSANGYLFISTCTAGDDFTVTMWGK
jgi:hypothetical protein